MSSNPITPVQIAQYLDKEYPDQELIKLKPADIVQLIYDAKIDSDTPFFEILNQGQALDPSFLKSTLWHWIRIKDQVGDEGHLKQANMV